MPSNMALKYAPWSISKLGQAETCPRQFELKNILKVVEEQAAGRSETRVGVAAHAVLENRIQGVSAKQALHIALEKTALTSSEQEMLSFLDDSIEAFLRRFDGFCKRNHVIEIMVERKWAIRADGTPVNFFDKEAFFRGVVDLGALTSNRDLYVLDHKSGKAKDPKKYYSKQLNAYSILATANIPEIVGVRGGIHYLQGNEDERIQWLEYKDTKIINEKVLPWLLDYIDTCAENLNTFEARPKQPWPCSWCNYRNSCQPYQELINGQKA